MASRKKKPPEPYVDPMGTMDLFDPEPYRIEQPIRLARNASPEGWLTKRQLAERLNISERTIERNTVGANAPWPCRYLSARAIRFSPSDVQFIERSLARPAGVA